MAQLRRKREPSGGRGKLLQAMRVHSFQIDQLFLRDPDVGSSRLGEDGGVLGEEITEVFQCVGRGKRKKKQEKAGGEEVFVPKFHRSLYRRVP